MNILNNLKSNTACFGLCLAGSVLFSRAAAAEVTLVEKDGWTFSFDGRIAAFASLAQGDDLPKPTPNPVVDPMTGVSMDVPHTVMGSNKTVGLPDVGWLSSLQGDVNGKLLAVRVRSGLVGDVLGFGLKRNITDTTTIKGYVSIFSTVEGKGRDKWAAVIPEAREGYFNIAGTWGSATVGRALGLFGRTSYEIDMLYGHGYGIGLPCTDEIGPACGHVGTGAVYPGYSAGVSYSTPSLGGFQAQVGVYDPIVYNNGSNPWQRAPYLRPEAALTFDTPLGDSGKLKVGVEGLYQPLSRVATDPTTAAKSDVSTSVWGATGGARVEVGPVRFGAAAFHGRGIGLGYALLASSSILDLNTSELRTFTGVYAQGALVFGSVHVAAGYGVANVDQLDSDKTNGSISVIHKQTGISAAVYYHVSDSVVLGLDYFRFMARWYGAPALDTNQMLTGINLAGEKQDLNFVNAGVTYHW